MRMRSIIRLPWALELTQPFADMHPECREHLFPENNYRGKMGAAPPRPARYFRSESTDKCVHYRQLSIEMLSGIFLIGLCCLSTAALVLLVCALFTILIDTPNRCERGKCSAIACTYQCFVDLCADLIL